MAFKYHPLDQFTVTREYRKWRHQRGPVFGRLVNAGDILLPDVSHLRPWNQDTPPQALPDPSAALLPPPQVGMSTLDRVVVGQVVDAKGKATGELWTIPVLGQHILIAGLPGAGKSSLIWSMMLGLGPSIRDGLCEVWAFDPKLGMELGMGEELFADLQCVENYEGVADQLEALVKRMHARAKSLKKIVRKHTPTVEEPLLVVLIDELAAIVAYLTDTKLRGRINKALSLLLSQGRAPGVCVVGASQDPRKEVLDLRDLFTTRIGLRLGSRTQVDMVLGAGAREAGAHCDLIPAGMPGMAYAMGEDGKPLRVRAFWNDDAAVRRIAETYRRPDNGAE